MLQWIIAAIAVGGLIFNSGVLYNDVKHLRESIKALWDKIDKIEQYLLEHKK